MAYVYAQKESESLASAATFVPDLPEHAADDYLAFCVTNDVGTTTITVSAGFTEIGTQVTSGGLRSAWFYKKATTSAEAAPTFTGTNNGWSVTTLTIRDADTTTFVDVVASAGWNAAYTATSPAATSTTDGCLILYSVSRDTGASLYIPPVDLYLRSVATSSASTGHMVGTRVQTTAGAITQITFRDRINTEGGGLFTIAIKNKSGGKRDIDVAGAFAPILVLGGYDATTPTWAAPNSVTGLTAINSISMSTALATVGVGSITNPGWGLSGSSFASAEATSGSGIWVGAFGPISSVDLSTTTLFVRFGIGATTPSRVGSEGMIVVFVDASNNWVAYQLLSRSNMAAANGYVANFTPGTTTAYASAGTINWANIVNVGYFHHRIDTGTTSITHYISLLTKSEGCVIVGGNSAMPLDVAQISSVLTAADRYYGISSFQGVGQFLNQQDLQLGNGTIPTYLKFTANSYELPVTTSTTWRAGAGTCDLTVYASASDTMDFSSSLLITDTKQNFTIHTSSSTSATYSFVGTSFVGWDVTWKTGVACTSAIFDGCYEIAAKGANFTNCTIKNTLSTDAAIAFDASGATMDSCTIDVTGTSAAYHLELGASVTGITLTDVTFTGTPVTDKVHVLATTGTVTITITGTTTLVAGDVTSAGATVVIASSPVYQSVTISGATAGSRIQIYDTTSSTELYNGTPTFPYTWTDSVAAAGNRAIRLRCTYVSGATAKDMIEANIGTCGTIEATKAVSYLVNQTADSVYNSNAIDGSTVTGITITDATDRVSINVAAGSISYPQIYAYQVYWLNTSTGIQDDFAFIAAPDTANYLFTGFKIKNTSSPTVALMITGGYGRDATTGLVADIIDTTGGNIYPSPDHVISYAVGSGVTSQDKTDITAGVWNAAARTLTQTIPSAADNADAVWSKTLP